MDDNAENIKADGIKQAAQNAAKKAAQKKRSKLIAKIIIAAIKPLIIMALIVVIATIVLSSIHHFLDLFDGTMQEDDWSNVPYVKETSVSGIEIDTAGNIMTGMTAEEMWNLLLENESRIDEYLDKPEELKKLINAELATQFLDTRPDPNAPIDWDEINSDPTLNYTQGLIKLKRALNSGETITMVYTDPATFQGYVNGYNENKSEENKKNALQYFTLETEAVLLNGGTNGIDNKNDTNNSLNESVGSGKNQSFEEAYVNDSIDSATGETDDTTEGGMGSGLMFWPTDGTNVSSKFGPRKQPKPGASTNHGGIDIGIRSNTNIYATEKGKVIMAKDNGSAGIEVRLDHGNGYISRYLHLNKPLVSVGQIVDKGQLIALSGNTGVSTGPHLHFEIQYNGKK